MEGDFLAVNARAAAATGCARAACRRRAWPLALVSWLLFAGCLETDSEVVGYSSHVREKDAQIPSVDADPVLKMRIAVNAGVMEVVPLRSGFAKGRVVQYWDFGAGSSSVEPVWQFRRRNAEGAPEEIGHPDLIDCIPGDDSYTPLRALNLVYVTANYDGERITSVRALEDAVELGLIEEPVALGLAVNWPVVPAATMVEVAEGDAPLVPTEVYYRGRVATLIELGGTAEHVGVFPIERGGVAIAKAYVLRRQNELDPVDEAFQMDFNADGDMQDSNVVFAVDAGEQGYSSIWQQIDVVVPSDYEFGASQSEDALFATDGAGPQAIDGVVVEYAPSEMLLNHPIRYVLP